MKNLILTSILLVTIVVPLVLARSRRPRRALLQVVTAMASFVVLYLLALRYLYPRLP